MMEQRKDFADTLVFSRMPAEAGVEARIRRSQPNFSCRPTREELTHGIPAGMQRQANRRLSSYPALECRKGE